MAEAVASVLQDGLGTRQVQVVLAGLRGWFTCWCVDKDISLCGVRVSRPAAAQTVQLAHQRHQSDSVVQAHANDEQHEANNLGATKKIDKQLLLIF